MNGTLYRGDCRAILPTLDADSVQCVVTSPPYLGLRDYGVDGQIGLEDVPDCLGWATGTECGACFVCELVGVFRHVHRVLKPDGVAWLNLGDSYAGSGRGGAPGGPSSTLKGPQPEHAMVKRNRLDVSDHQREHAARGATSRIARRQGLKEKDLMGIPWRVALALQADGWYLRQDVVWNKPNPMPESVVDRCTKAHEYLFLLTRSPRYYFDAAAIAEPSIYATGKTREVERPKGHYGGKWADPSDGRRNDGSFKAIRETRNRRSVWTIATEPFAGAHFATFPSSLIEPCIMAGSRPGAGPLHGRRHHGGGGRTPGPAVGGVRVEPGLCRHGHGADPQHARRPGPGLTRQAGRRRRLQVERHRLAELLGRLALGRPVGGHGCVVSAQLRQVCRHAAGDAQGHGFGLLCGDGETAAFQRALQLFQVGHGPTSSR